jgi:hypothetical protein
MSRPYRTHSHELRLERALHHLQSLKAEVARWKEKRPYRVVNEPHTYPGYKVVKVRVLEDPPPVLGSIVGDCVHNLRAALDNLVYSLAESRHGGPLPSDIEGKPQFPIFRERDKFLSKGKDRIRDIAPEAQAIIEGLQPYHRGSVYWDDPLWQLHELSNRDKHRLPFLMLLLPDEYPEFFVKGGRATDIQHWVCQIEDGTVIAQYRPVDNASTEMEVNLHETMSIGFRQGWPPIPPLMPAESVLERILHHVNRDVVSPLRPFLRRFQEPPLEDDDPYLYTDSWQTPRQGQV